MIPLEVFTPDVNPLGAQWLSALVGLIPIVTMMVTLAVLRWKAHWAGLFSTGVAILVAATAFGMPIGLALNSAVEGFFFGLFPIIWIVIAAIWFYQITVVSGRFNDLRDTFNLISDDPRIQAILIAFCFGGLLEALAGFGAPVAITGVMLMAIGFPAFRAAMVVLLANTAPVAFGAIAIPILTAGNLTGIDYREIGAYVGHQTPILAFFVPFLLLLLADGKRGLKECWPVAGAIGAAFAVTQWVSATWISVELTDVIASLVGLGVGVLVLRVWQPTGGAAALDRMRTELASSGGTDISGANDDHARARGPLTSGHIAMALLPYILVILVFGIAKLVPPITKALTSTDIKFGWPGLYGNVLNAAGEPVSSTMFNFNWLSNPGALLAFTTILVAIIYKVPPGAVWGELRNTVIKMRWSILTVGSVLALAYVLNLSGQTISVGTWIAGTGAAFAFLSPMLGWIGTAITGSDTSANALFAKLQQTAAIEAGLDPTLMVAANTSGGVVGKMISPQNLAIACSAVGIVGQESALLRKVIWWSLGMLATLCLLIGLQSTPILSWMLP